MDMEYLDLDEVYKAIRLGTSDAIWKMLTTSLDSCDENFYHYIKLGAKEAMEKFVEYDSD